ncbi:hypothetical protein [Kitasatospora sp. NBC_00315]|uniref:hypothetical protein n=1 Tax=Kitasatospora sp. NBC_00315 TaxID=2975963 RepID=UPI00324ED5FC
MAEIEDEQLLLDAGFERVYIELDRYDGPREGLAEVYGAAHYFRAAYDFAHPDASDDEYFVWPASASLLAQEQEQWAIFVEWNTRFEAGAALPDSHPGHGAINSRYDELTEQLVPHREVPAHARRVTAEWRLIAGARYRLDGTDYLVKWQSDGDGHR